MQSISTSHPFLTQFLNHSLTNAAFRGRIQTSKIWVPENSNSSVQGCLNYNLTFSFLNLSLGGTTTPGKSIWCLDSTSGCHGMGIYTRLYGPIGPGPLVFLRWLLCFVFLAGLCPYSWLGAVVRRTSRNSLNLIVHNILVKYLIIALFTFIMYTTFSLHIVIPSQGRFTKSTLSQIYYVFELKGTILVIYKFWQWILGEKCQY